MRKELISDEDMMEQLRERGISDISKVKAAYIESDGEISVIEREENGDRKWKRKKRE